MHKTPLTVLGAEQLRTELQRLQSVDRQQVIAAISEARAHGDLKENAEYHAAKEQQGFIEARIRHLEHMLFGAHIIDVKTMTNKGKVVFGSTITIVNVETDDEVTYQIVGHEEANVKDGKISVNAPIARGFIGKEVGDVITAQTPAGTVEYEILRVEYI
ncbi:MAG: transcription elongation factor GreA [Gammaproteobacteria bacterium]